MNEAILRFENVVYRYADAAQQALQGLNLTVQRNRVTAILGPNGAGKTTLLRLAYGRFQPQSGQIWLEERPLADYSRQELGRKVALVPQRETNPFSYTLLEYVLLGRAPHLSPLEMPSAADIEIARKALETVGLLPLVERTVQSLSGGEFQLLLVARALAQQADLLLLDEPTSHLDLGNKKRLVACLQNLVAGGTTILFTSHEPEVVAALADQVVLMRGGQVLCSGTLDEIWDDGRLSEVYGIPVQVHRFNGHRYLTWV